MSDHTQKSDNHTAGETPEFFTASDSDLVVDGEPSGLISLTKANRLLSERGVRVYGDYPGKEIALWSPIPDKRNTHRALLIAVEPIVRDTPESLLRELVALLESEQAWYTPPFIERARAVLEREGGRPMSALQAFNIARRALGLPVRVVEGEPTAAYEAARDVSSDDEIGREYADAVARVDKAFDAALRPVLDALEERIDALPLERGPGE